MKKGSLQRALRVPIPPELRARLAAGALDETQGGTRGS
jgi:hypothetical protein